MTAIFRVGLIRLCGQNAAPKLLESNAAGLSVAFTQKCFISGRTMRGCPRVPKAKPYPYETKSYNLINSWFDKTTHRFDENTKLICVEGPVAAGKTQFAEELAKELDMLYVPDPTMDMIYINPYGYDMRQLDPQLPKMSRSYDERNFNLDPTNPLAAQFQIRKYMLKYSLYVDALMHILSTGQGAVIDRSCYSDMVFIEAMVRNGFVSKGAHSAYHEIRANTIGELMKPHLVIYLDVPVEGVKKLVKARNVDYEVNSKALTDSFLTDMECAYKQHFLKDISTHAELLIYDWTAGGETEVVVEDIERINFEQFEKDPHNKKMKDWRYSLEHEWTELRIKYCNQKCDLMNYFNVPRFDVPELCRDGDDAAQFREVWYNAPGMKYLEGYNTDMGDKGLLWKNDVGVRPVM